MKRIVEKSNGPLKIAIIADWFAEKMGYAENCLPKALAALGHDVHVFTSNAQIYFDSPTYKETYEPFIGPPIVECVVKSLDGYTLHRLPLGKWKPGGISNRLYIKNLVRELIRVRPDIVQTFDIACPTTYQVSAAKPILGYKLFFEAHTHASVFVSRSEKTMRERFKAVIVNTLNRISSVVSVKCYPISRDAANIAVEHLGMQRSKIKICSLGVDTAMFHPPSDSSSQRVRKEVRERLGFRDSDVVCVYSGRLTEDKGPLYLAKAIDKLSAGGSQFRALFVGSGTESDLAAIKACSGSVIHPFVAVRDLPPYYWSADIGVWPKQESTSQLDAAACGLPLILSDRIEVRERVDGNGLTYQESNVNDLASKIVSLSDERLRRQMGEIGSRKVLGHFSWELIAKQRVKDYADSLRSRPLADRITSEEAAEEIPPRVR